MPPHRARCIPPRSSPIPGATVVLLLLTSAPVLSSVHRFPTLGYPCNPTFPAPPCTAYLTFHSEPPLYSSPLSISYLLNASVSAVNDANNITHTDAVSPIPDSRLLLVPVPCSRTARGYYQHNTTYSLQMGDTYWVVANYTLQGLTTTSAILAQNLNTSPLNLYVGTIITVPLFCACPSAQQAAAGVKNLLTYVVAGGEEMRTVAHRFRVDYRAARDANRLPRQYPATGFFDDDRTLLVPLKNLPTPDMLTTPDILTTSPAPSSSPVMLASLSRPGSARWIGVGAGSGCGVLALAGVVTLSLLWLRSRRHGGALEKETQLFAAVRDAVESLTVYEYIELERATAGFAEEKRVAGSLVYRAVINGQALAVKRVAGDVRGEVGVLGRVNHSCLVRLLGLCAHRGDTYMVLEFVENGALSDWLHGGNAACLLGWKQRVQVACDVAGGLNYLHHFTIPPYVHKNLNSCNVLLDANFRAKISNFGFARAMAVSGDGGAQMTLHVVGTQGYLAPEYLEHGLISPQLDVFTFGVILLELLSGKEAAFVSDDGHWLLWEAAEGLADGYDADAWFKLRAFMDPRLLGHYPFGLAFAVAVLAMRCVARDPRARPSMDEVFVSLSAVYNSTVDWDPQNYDISDSMVLGR